MITRFAGRRHHQVMGQAENSALQNIQARSAWFVTFLPQQLLQGAWQALVSGFPDGQQTWMFESSRGYSHKVRPQQCGHQPASTEGASCGRLPCGRCTSRPAALAVEAAPPTSAELGSPWRPPTPSSEVLQRSRPEFVNQLYLTYSRANQSNLKH
jgi:hypothetical protein